MATISEVARLFETNRDTVKWWTSEFAEHLSPAANPPKGRERQFIEADLRVLALIAGHWDEDPDIEHVHAMLNSGSQNEERFLEFARLHTPIFQDVPNEIDETWRHGVVIGGMTSRDLQQVARSYKAAADELAKQAMSGYEPHELDYPILFLYRHAIEIYLKALLQDPPNTHDLSTLVELLKEQYGVNVADWIADRIRDFHKIDQVSDLFRYAESPSSCELWIDFHQLKSVMDRLVVAFESHLT